MHNTKFVQVPNAFTGTITDHSAVKCILDKPSSYGKHA